MADLPSETRQLYRHLRSELFGVHYHWLVFRQLFLSETAVDLLDASAPRFFIGMRADLLDLIALSLSRLADRAETFGHPNASLEQLVESLDLDPQTQLALSLGRHLGELRDYCTRIVTWRKKWAAHRDLAVALQPIGKLGFSPAEVDNAIASLDSFMTEFEKVYADPKVDYTYDSTLSPEENMRLFNERESLKVYAPAPYENILYQDDGNTILDLLRKAKKE